MSCNRSHQSMLNLVIISKSSIHTMSTWASTVAFVKMLLTNRLPCWVFYF